MKNIQENTNISNKIIFLLITLIIYQKKNYIISKIYYHENLSVKIHCKKNETLFLHIKFIILFMKKFYKNYKYIRFLSYEYGIFSIQKKAPGLLTFRK
jgi:hypothetical protein